MPWLHCGATLLDDQRTCPACGAAKQSWTTRLKNTKVLALGERFRGDGEAQADVLLGAAATAAPFCEECEQTEEEDDGWDDDEDEPTPDQAAQADTLAAASESGAPFCEECERAEEEEEDDGWDEDDAGAEEEA